MAAAAIGKIFSEIPGDKEVVVQSLQIHYVEKFAHAVGQLFKAASGMNPKEPISANPPSNAREFWKICPVAGEWIKLDEFNGKEIAFISITEKLIFGRVVSLIGGGYAIQHQDSKGTITHLYNYDVRAICLRKDFEKFNFKYVDYYGN